MVTLQETLKYLSQQLVTYRNLACHTHHQLTCVHASRLYASIVNKLVAGEYNVSSQSDVLAVCCQGDEMDYSITVDMDYVWSYYQSTSDVSVHIRAVTWWIWVSVIYSVSVNTLYNVPATVMHVTLI